MARHRFKPFSLENISIGKAVNKGYCLAHHEDKTIFVEEAAPGDIANIQVFKKHKRQLFAKITQLISPSEQRTKPPCVHYGLCGGCKWQHLSYDAQLNMKKELVIDSFQRLGHFEFPSDFDIIGCKNIFDYRNKMDYAFAKHRWIEEHEKEFDTRPPGLGFHLAGRYDKVLDIKKCHLQADFGNTIRNAFREKAIENHWSFYDPRNHEGLLRNLILRNNTQNEWMVILMATSLAPDLHQFLKKLPQIYPEIISVFFAKNTKQNDSIYDLDMELIVGEPYITESINDIEFVIRPKSFFQTNPKQAQVLYQTALNMVSFQGNETIYDLYCGTGTISLLLAQKAKKVIGIETVPQAIEDAQQNALKNKIDNAHFYLGDVKDILQKQLFEKEGHADILFIDPPRVGMHKDVIEFIIASNINTLVYISCNPATQARDIDLLKDVYTVSQICAVDMFPQTYHIENVVRLDKKSF